MNTSLDNLVLPPSKLLINGEWVDASNGQTGDVYDPATGENFTSIAIATPDDVDTAVKAARATFESDEWRKMRPLQRGKLLENVARLIEENAEQLALLESYDNGKPYHFALQVDVPQAAEIFRYMGGWCSKLHGQTLSVSPDGQTYHAYTRKEPVGVVGAIVPWNYPFAMAAWKVATALAAGCTMLLKPAEITSLTALRLGELVLEAGIPAGALNVITGKGSVAGQAMLEHPDVDKIAFTGSTEVGRQLVHACAADFKRLTLELGGKSPTIIMPDADLEKAIPGAAMAIFFNSGQICFAGSRLLVHESIYEEVIQGISEFAKQLPIGNGRDANTVLGPVVSKAQQDSIMRYVDIAKEEGARVTTGGERIEGEGYYVQPTVLADITPDMTVFKEEIFGPVLAATPFKDIDEAVALANDSIYGLGCNVWSQDINTAHTLANRVEAGTVWVNCYFIIDPDMPFGGFKQSGWGREVGEEGISEYLENKSVCVLLD
jgi:p-cumic aldehyde dehydrogenase